MVHIFCKLLFVNKDMLRAYLLCLCSHISLLPLECLSSFLVYSENHDFIALILMLIRSAQTVPPHDRKSIKNLIDLLNLQFF